MIRHGGDLRLCYHKRKDELRDLCVTYNCHLSILTYPLTHTDKMDAYKQAILENPSLLKSAVVMDVGSGPGIIR